MIPREFKLVQSSLKLRSSEKLNKEEPLLGSTDKKQMTLGLKFSDKGVLVIPESVNNQVTQTTKKNAFAFKEG